MKVEHAISIPESNLKKIIAKNFKGIKPEQVSFSVSENYYGDPTIVKAIITYQDEIEEMED